MTLILQILLYHLIIYQVSLVSIHAEYVHIHNL